MQHLFLLRWIGILLLWVAVVSSHVTYSSSSPYNASFTPQHLRYLRNETKSLFNHAWNSYMKYGFPMDEVKPITCEPYGPDIYNIHNYIRNDVLGNVSLTLLDNLDSLIVLEKWDDLEMALQFLESEKRYFFDKDVIVQVFEMTIRSLGGLLSSHIILSDASLFDSPRFKLIATRYSGFLLDMAYDLGLRLIPAFKSSNNIPAPRVNLKKGIKGVPYKLQQETCTSGATTPVLEMTLLSKLTGDLQFEHYSQLAFWKIWNSRLSLDLLPMSIDPLKSEWKDSITGIGASIDSFYEYCVKGSILFDDSNLWEVFKTSYKALLAHLAKGSVDEFTPLIYANVGSENGIEATIWIDSLSAFWPGVQALSGLVKDAIGTHLVFMKLWDYFQLIPERWNCLLPKEKITESNDVIGLEWYPLRPEFIESTYYLYRATGDPMYLHIGETVLNVFKNKFKTNCGFKGFQDIRIGEYQNRMESFVLSETLKYLYLLFDTDNSVFLHKKQMDNKNWIFSTEGHPLWLEKHFTKNNRYAKSQFDGKYGSDDIRLISGDVSNPVRNLFFLAKKNTKDKRGSIPYLKIDVDADLGLEDPYDKKFETCELNPFYHLRTDFLKSGYYAFDNLFELDYAFSDYLFKPSYVPETNLDNSYIELANDFYQKYTLFDHKPMCSIPRTTGSADMFVGDLNMVKNTLIKKLDDNTLVIPDFHNLRLSLEFLQAGKVDSQHELITEEYIDVSNQQLIEEVGRITLYDTIIRITKVNGIFVKPDVQIIVPEFLDFVDPMNDKSHFTSSGTRLLLNGILVENVIILRDTL